MSITKKDIITIAKEKFNHMFFPTKTNHPEGSLFRVPDDMEPFGFEYHGVSIEVHVTRKRLGVWGEVYLLFILGIREDGMVRVIAKGVQSHG